MHRRVAGRRLPKKTDARKFLRKPKEVKNQQMPRFHVQTHLVTTIHLYEFINIDLQRKGTYSIQLKLYSHHPDFNTKTFYLPTFKDNSPTTVGWKNSATDLAGGNTSSKFVSDDFNIEFVDQTTSIDKVLRFSTVVQVKNFEEGEVDVLGISLILIKRSARALRKHLSIVQRCQGANT
jgi:hypothetical protein